MTCFGLITRAAIWSAPRKTKQTIGASAWRTAEHQNTGDGGDSQSGWRHETIAHGHANVSLQPCKNLSNKPAWALVGSGHSNRIDRTLFDTADRRIVAIGGGFGVLGCRVSYERAKEC
jgi:hypothetical protein